MNAGSHSSASGHSQRWDAGAAGTGRAGGHEADGGPCAHASWSGDGAPQPRSHSGVGWGLSRHQSRAPAWRGSGEGVTKAPSGSYLEGRAGEGNQSCFSLLSKLLAFGSGVNLWGRTILWYSSCICGRLFGAEQGDGYCKSGVGACSTPEWCLATEPW